MSLLREFSVASSPVMEMVTSSVGSSVRTTVKVEKSSSSEVRRSSPSVVPLWAMETPGYLMISTPTSSYSERSRLEDLCILIVANELFSLNAPSPIVVTLSPT